MSRKIFVAGGGPMDTGYHIISSLPMLIRIQKLPALLHNHLQYAFCTTQVQTCCFE